MIERTLVLLKPDAVQRSIIGEIISRFEKAGLKIKELPYFFPERKEGKTKISIGVSSDFAKEAIRFWLSRKR